MAFTKLYLSAFAAPFTPATLRGAWDNTAQRVDQALVTQKKHGGEATSVSASETSASNTFDMLMYRGISSPLKAQTLSGTINVAIGVDVSAADMDAYWHVHVYVTQGDTDTPRGTILTDYLENTTNEWPATDQVIALQSAQSLSSLAIQDGDRIVVELGCICRNVLTGSRTAKIYYGTVNSNDHSNLGDASVGTNPLTTEQAGFLEFSVSIEELDLDTRQSQFVVESLRSDNPEDLHSQFPVELLRTSSAPSVQSQFSIERLQSAGNAPTRHSQFVVEVLQEGQPPVITDPATDVEITTATLHGRIHPFGNSNRIGFFRWGIENPPFVHETPFQGITSSLDYVAYQQALSGLEEFTTYYFQAVMIASGEDVGGVGEVLSFETSGNLGGIGVDRVSNVFLEIMEPEESHGFATQIGIEQGDSATASGFVTQQGLEEGVAPPHLRVGQFALEEGQAPPHLRVTQVGLELTIEEVVIPISNPQDFCVEIEDPVAFCSWQPYGSGSARIWFGECDLDDPLAYYGGWKEDRLLSISEIRRCLSGTNWDYEHGSFSVRWADDDYLIRQYLTSELGQYWYKKEIECYWVTPEGRRAGVEAAKIATGFVDTDPVYDEEAEAMSVTMQCRDRLAIAMGWTQTGQAKVPRRTLTDITLPVGTITRVQEWGKAAPLVYGERVIPSGAISCWWTSRKVVLPDANEWYEFMIGGHAVKEVPDWFYVHFNDLHEVDVFEQNQGDGTDWIVPGSAGWAAVMGNANPYVDYVGGDGRTRRWAFAYGKGTKAEEVASGISQFRVNVRGIERVGDGSGEVITDLLDIAVHQLENVFLVDDEGPLTVWNDEPLFGNEPFQMINYGSFNVVKAQRADELEGGPGLTSGWQAFGVLGAFGEQVETSEALKWLQMCGDFRLGQDYLHRIGAWAIDYNLPSGFLSPLSDIHDIHERTFKVQPRLNELVNSIDYRYQQSYIESGIYDADKRITTSEVTIKNWGNEWRRQDMSFNYIVDDTIMNLLIGTIRKRKIEVPSYITLEGDICLIGPQYDVGNYVALDHWRGIQMSGWVGRAMWVLENTNIPQSRRVRLVMLDVDKLVPASAKDALNFGSGGTASGGTGGTGGGAGSGDSSGGGGGVAPPPFDPPPPDPPDPPDPPGPPVTEADWYVATNGNDNWTGTAPTFEGGNVGPFRTINKGKSVTVAGQLCAIRGGTYIEHLVDGWNSGTDDNNRVRFVNYNGETVWVEAPNFGAPGGGGANWCIRLQNGESWMEFDGINMRMNSRASSPLALGGHHIRFKNFEAEHTSVAGANDGLIFVNGDDNEFLNSNVHGVGNGYGYYIAGRRNIINGFVIWNVCMGGIHVYSGVRSTDDNVVANGIVRDITQSQFFNEPDTRTFGVLFAAIGSRCLAYNVIVTGLNLATAVGGNAAFVMGGHGHKFLNCVAAFNTAPGIIGIKTDSDTHTDCEIRNCISWQNNGPEFEFNGPLTQSNNSWNSPVNGANPLFVSSTDFHLQGSSPCFDQGMNLSGIFTTDLDGNPRPSSGPWDQGVYQT